MSPSAGRRWLFEPTESIHPSSSESPFHTKAKGRREDSTCHEQSTAVVPQHPAADGEKFPILAWIHGGSLLYGGANYGIYDAVSLVSHGTAIGRPIVAVNFNYHLGLGGFLASSRITRVGRRWLCGQWQLWLFGPEGCHGLDPEIYRVAVWRPGQRHSSWSVSWWRIDWTSFGYQQPDEVSSGYLNVWAGDHPPGFE